MEGQVVSWFENRINRIRFLIYCAPWDTHSRPYRDLKGELDGEG
jgi:hypothetical protein